MAVPSYWAHMGSDSKQQGRKQGSSQSFPEEMWARLRNTPARETITNAMNGPRFPALPEPTATQLPEPMITPPKPPMLEPYAEAPTATMEFQPPGLMGSGLTKQQIPPTFHVSKSMTPLPQPSLQPVEHYPTEGFRFMPGRLPPPAQEPQRKLVASGGMSKQRKKETK